MTETDSTTADGIDEQTTLTLTERELRQVAAGELAIDDVLDEPPTEPETLLSRRAMLALGLAGLGSLIGAGGGLLATERVAGATSGQLGTVVDPIARAHVSELSGPVVSTASRIDTLRPIRIAEDGASISVGSETAVFRYQP